MRLYRSSRVQALYDARQIHELEPHARCRASGAARQFMTPYGVRVRRVSGTSKNCTFSILAARIRSALYTWMAGRILKITKRPTMATPQVVGRGNTLVVDTVGYLEDFWLDRRGLPHTEQLHTIERFTRTDSNTIDYRIAIDDPGAYTAPYEGGFNLRWNEGQELFEYVCQQANYASELMVGGGADSVDRSSAIVP